MNIPSHNSDLLNQIVSQQALYLYFNKTPKDSTVRKDLGSSEPDDLRVASTSGIRWFDTSLKVSLFYL